MSEDDDLFVQADDATPLSPEDREGLRITTIVLRRELNELEQQNILRAESKLFARRVDPVGIAYGDRLHREMFGDVWRWAGSHRTSGKNIGVDPRHIIERLHQTYGNVRFWIDNDTFDPDEIAVRFHHELVFIHPHPNGNGRWSRMMADLLLFKLRRPRFVVGPSLLINADDQRSRYIRALRSADRGDIEPLLAFMRP